MPKPVFKQPEAPKEPLAVVDGVPIWSLFTELMDVKDAVTRKHPKNDNVHDDTQTLYLANAIRIHGFRRTLVLSRQSGKIVAGHGALQAAMTIPMRKVPIMWQDFETPEMELAHLMADNEMARQSFRNEQQTAENLQLLQLAEIDLNLTGIMEDDRVSLLALLNEEEEVQQVKGVGSFEEISDELPGAKALKEDMLFMPSNAIHDIPELKLDMCMEVPTPFDSWAGPDASPPQEGMHYLYNITSVMRGLPLDRSVFGFYADDHRFEVVWNKPASYAAKLLNAGFMGAVTPNFSLHAGGPEAAKIWNVYRSRWVGRYFQEAGIKVIPDVQTAGMASLDYCLAGIPKGLPAICIQFQTAKKTQEEVYLSRQILAEVEKRLEFSQIIVYGGDHAEEFLKGVFKHAEPIHILNRMQKRRAVIKKNSSFAAK